MGNTAVLHLNVESKVIENVGYPDTLSMESIDIQLWHLQNETWSKVVSFVPREFMPLMIGSSVHYINGNNKLIIVHEWGDIAEINVRAKKMHGFFSYHLYPRHDRCNLY
ncbi:hypothetical protein Hanom_Chr16g01431491 [Helianthus anomalus]